MKSNHMVVVLVRLLAASLIVLVVEKPDQSDNRDSAKRYPLALTQF